MRFAVVLTGAAIVAAGAMVGGQAEQIHVVLPRDAIPAIDKPEFDDASKAKSLADRELVIGIAGEHEQRAYSTWQLDRHEIVNDVFEGQPIAVTW